METGREREREREREKVLKINNEWASLQRGGREGGNSYMFSGARRQDKHTTETSQVVFPLPTTITSLREKKNVKRRGKRDYVTMHITLQPVSS